MFVVATNKDNFTHRVGDIDSLKDLIFGITDDAKEASRIAKIAGTMREGDVFASNGLALFYKEDK